MSCRNSVSFCLCLNLLFYIYVLSFNRQWTTSLSKPLLILCWFSLASSYQVQSILNVFKISFFFLFSFSLSETEVVTFWLASHFVGEAFLPEHPHLGNHPLYWSDFEWNNKSQLPTVQTRAPGASVCISQNMLFWLERKSFNRISENDRAQKGLVLKVKALAWAHWEPCCWYNMVKYSSNCPDL